MVASAWAQGLLDQAVALGTSGSITPTRRKLIMRAEWQSQSPVKRTPPSSTVFLFSSRAKSWILLETELEKGYAESGISFRFL